MSNLSVANIVNPTTADTTPTDNLSKQVCKAWVNFDGTGVPTIRDSYNVASITDNGTGDYTVNFSQSMSNANYSATAGLYSIAYNQSLGFDTGTVNGIRMISGANSVVANNNVIHLQIFGS